MRIAATVAVALLALAACKPAPPPPGPRHAALTGGTFVRVEGDGYDQIYVLRPGATGWTLVGDTPKPPLAAGRYWTLAPNGLLGAFIVDGTSLFVQSVDGGPARPIATAPTGETICAPAWSADSARVAYLLRRGIGEAATGLRYIVNADGTDRLRLIEPPTDGACDQPAAAAAGDMAAYLNTPGDARSIVVLHRFIFGYVQPDIPGVPVAVLAVSSDAKHVVVLGDVDGSRRCYLVEVPTGRAVPLPIPVKPPVAPVLLTDDGRVLATVGQRVETFDLTGRLMATSPVITTRPAATVSLVTWSP